MEKNTLNSEETITHLAKTEELDSRPIAKLPRNCDSGTKLIVKICKWRNIVQFKCRREVQTIRRLAQIELANVEKYSPTKI